MPELVVAPYAPSLIESMRSIGYSLESAIADLIDNSISANASRITIRYSSYDNPYVAILDDGYGMRPDELTKAMRHGSRNPWDIRAANDLGRFGLGLKTASLSQCRKLTVVSLKDGELSARTWDLDLIAKREDWIIYVPEQHELSEMPLVNELIKQAKGTVVIWENLDRIVAGEPNINQALTEKMDLVRVHLAMVFHRYLLGEQGINRIKIHLNNNPVATYDPFLVGRSEPLQDEFITVENSTVLIKPYILPHRSKLTPDELSLAGGEEGLRRNQGFYIYRNKRLIIWGTWFRLTKQEELSKLARVRVDIPNTLDHLWTLDIKKSAAHPPDEVRQNLKRIVEKIVGNSRRVYTFRGRRTNDGKLVRSWNRIENRNGISYLINRTHPIISAFSQTLDEKGKNTLELLLDTIERTFPADSLYADMASDHPRNYEESDIENKLRMIAQCLLHTAGCIEGGKERLLTSLPMLDPFCDYPQITADLVKELKNVH